MSNQIAIDGLAGLELTRLVCKHLDYFQTMMGYDGSVGELVALATRKFGSARRH